jgi:cobalt-zinc-cadmium efflux system protein
MSSGHSHGLSASQRHLRPLAIAFGLVVGFMLVEFATGIWTGSLALVSDAGHMATDALGLGMALAAIVFAKRKAAVSSRTYGLYRLEIVAALGNAALLFVVATYVIFEAIQRLQNPSDVLTTPMLVVAVGGLAVNIVGWRLLRSGAEESLNVKGAYYEVIADLAGSIGVIVAALIIIATGWPYADPLIAVLIGLFILPRSWTLGRQAIHILMQAAPPTINTESVKADLRSIEGIIDVHDLHIWTLTSDMDVATAHLMIPEGADTHPILDAAQNILQQRHGIAHATVQIEPDTHHSCDEITW